jgi:uncharacterized membrane protein YfcA
MHEMAMSSIIMMMLLLFAAAGLYAAVGHGGASAYLLVFALWGMSWTQAKPLALAFNVVVSLLATVVWWQRTPIAWRMFLPLIAGSMPAAFWGNRLPMKDEWFEYGVALVLLAAATRLWLGARESDEPRHRAPVVLLFLVGGIIGLFSGWMGIGGGVFLTPFLLLARYARVAQAAVISAAFIFVNSSAGLFGWVQSGKQWPMLFWWLAPVVLFGGWLGSQWGSRCARSQALQRCLAGMLVVAMVKMIFLS